MHKKLRTFRANVDVQELTVDGNAVINNGNVTALTVQQLTTLNAITATGTLLLTVMLI